MCNSDRDLQKLAEGAAALMDDELLREIPNGAVRGAVHDSGLVSVTL